TRWFELGVFEPIFRGHAEKGTRDREPWVDGPVHERIRKSYIELRYRLMPYIYSVTEEAARTGLPPMRPVFLELPEESLRDEAALKGIDELFFFGDDLLVAPRLDDGLQPYEAHLPRGEWYDYWSGQRFVVNQEPLLLDPPLETMPMFVRAGAILPQAPVVQSTAETPKGPLELRVYPGPNCRGSVYDDDGRSFAFERGQFFRQELRCEASADGVKVQLLAPQGSFQPWWKSIDVTVYGAKRPARTARIDGITASGVRYDARQKSASVSVPASRSATEIELRW
ncbi:MAG: TIM-barrel domain-containing protein, partial [Polyangiales bacterium]